ncbi:MAG: adenylate/guanylate cyclase domain-containing protein [Panacagrimonas sp.]
MTEPSSADTASKLPRGQVSFVMTDIEGSTALLRRLGDDYAGVVFRHRELVREILARNDGYLVAHEGDSCFCAFGDAVAAVAACIQIQTAIAIEPWPVATQLRVRIGVHTGEAQPFGDNYIALAVHQASRVAAAGHGGQTLVSARTAEAVSQQLPGGAALRDLGRFQLKDFPEAETLYQLCHPQLRSDFPTPRSLSARGHNLPRATNSFIGRADERSRLGQLLRERRIVNVVGPGGVGKTRLALEVGGDLLPFFPDGVWLVELATAQDDESAVRACAFSLGVGEERGRSLIESIAAHVETRTLLLILDNCEHLLPVAGRLAAKLAQSANLRVLATSREPLHLTGEHLLRMTPLPTQQTAGDISEAARLFLDRIQEHQSDLVLDADTAAVVHQICRRLDGMPLALELAASRARALSLRELSLRLRDRFRLLSGGGPRDSGRRHQTLRATVEWSYEALSATERRMFERLSVFADGWDLDAAESVCSSEDLPRDDTLDLLTALVDKSLVTYVPVASDHRYGMLETLREFAAEKLRASDAAPVQRRLLDWAVELTQTAVPCFTGPEGSPWMARLVREQDNVRAALELGHKLGAHAATLRLTALQTHFWIKRGRLREGAAWAERAAALPVASPGERAALLIGLGRLLRGSDLARAEHSLRVALDLAIEAGDVSTRLEALKQMTTNTRDRGDYAAAEKLLQEQAELLAGLDDPYRRFIVETERATLMLQQGRSTEAVVQLRERLREAELQRWRFDRARLMNNLAVGLSELGEHEESLRLATEGAGIFRELGSVEGMAHALSTAGMALLQQNAPERARQHFLEVGRIALEVGSSHLGPEALQRLAAVELQVGEAQLAARYAYAADSLYAAVGYQREPADQRLRDSVQASLARTFDVETLARVRSEAMREAKAIFNEAIQVGL